MANPYKPTVLTPDVTVNPQADERPAVCRVAVVSVYGLCNLCLFITVLSSTLSTATLFVFLVAAAPATMWAYIDADIRGYRIRLWEIAVLAMAWPIGLLVYLSRTRPERGVQLWLIHLLAIVGVFVACVIVFVALMLALLLAVAFTVGIPFPAQN